MSRIIEFPVADKPITESEIDKHSATPSANWRPIFVIACG
jgi:hypothetical protein